jgi:hypothetical protein
LLFEDSRKQDSISSLLEEPPAMRLASGMLVGLSIGALVGLACILALFFAPYDEPIELEGGGLQLSFLYFIAAMFIAGCGIFSGIIGLAATAAVARTKRPWPADDAASKPEAPASESAQAIE